MTRGNVAWELNEMSKGKAAISTTVFPVIQTSDGIVLCYSLITTSATITALCESQGLKFATGCLHICVKADAAATIKMMCNYGTAATTPNWYAVISTGTDTGDA